ncbi:MAG: MqnA/MqnD/SBP family protein, partial [Planctomycetota bacterium]
MNVACVRYLNTAPLVYGLESVRGLTVEPAAPSHIAGMLIDGRADIGLASIVDAVRGPVPMVVLPVGMIGCAGPTLTVRVHSDRPFDQIRALPAATDSHTSVAL